MSKKAFTLDVLINGEHHYYSLEGYTLQCILSKMRSNAKADNTMSFYQKFDKTTRTITYDSSSVDATSTLSQLKNILEYDFEYLIDSDNLIWDSPLWQRTTSVAPTAVDVIAAVNYKEDNNKINVQTYTLADIVSCDGVTDESGLIELFQAQMRYRIAKLSDEKYSKLVKSWVDCITTTLHLWGENNTSMMLVSNEPIITE